MKAKDEESPQSGDDYAGLLKAQYLRMRLQREADPQSGSQEEVKLRLFLALLKGPERSEGAATGS